MNQIEKSKEELISELTELQKKYNSLKEKVDSFNLIRNPTDEALNDSEVLFRNFIENSLSGIYFYSLNSEDQLIFQGFNKAANNLLKIDHSQFIGKTIIEAFPSLQLTEVPYRYKETAEKGIPWSTEHISYSDNLITGAFEVKAFQTVPGNMVVVFNDITSRKNAEQLLKISEERFQLVVNASEQGIWDWSLEKNEVYFSPLWKRQIGYEEHELDNVFDTWVNHLHPDDKERSLHILNENIKHPVSSFTIEFRFRHKIGTYRWIHNSASSLLNSNGEVVRLFGMHTDITEKKISELLLKEKTDEIETQNEEYCQLNEELLQTNSQLYESKLQAESNEKKFSLMINNSNDAFVLINSNAEQIYISNAAVRDTGFEIDELKGPVNKVIHPDDLNIVYDTWNKILENKDKSFRVQYRHIHKTKGYIWYEAFAQNYLDNPLINAVVVNVRDITQIKENEKYISILIDNLPCIALIIKNETREIVKMNKYAEDFGALVGHTCHLTCFHNQENCDYCLASDAWNKKETSEKEVFVKDRYYRCIWIPLNDQFYLHYIFDITDQKKLESDLIKAKEHAEESDRLKTAFLQNMSHEIRTPMNAIMGFSSLLIDNYGNNQKLEQFSSIINQRCRDLLDIINDILDIAKIESGQLTLNIEVCKLEDLFSELNMFFIAYQNKIGKQHLAFNMHISEHEPKYIIKTDKIKLKQILINLISNSFKFTEFGSVDCGYKILDNYIEFYVSDTGVGISPDNHDFIFERFSQVSNSSPKNIGGTGLGLPIVKGLTNLLGGKLWLTSLPDKGTTFYFTIPLILSEFLPIEPIEVVNDSELRFTNKTILIVEDDFYNAQFLNEILSGKGLNIISVANAEKAIAVVENQNIDLILMDIRLPGMNGYEATRIIKKSNPKIKVIAQTAYAAQDEFQKAIDAGCIDYLSKPTKRELLLSKLIKYLV